MVDLSFVDNALEEGQRHAVEAAVAGAVGAGKGYLQERGELGDEYSDLYERGSDLAEEIGIGAAVTALSDAVSTGASGIAGTQDIVNSDDYAAMVAAYTIGERYGESKAHSRTAVSEARKSEEDDFDIDI